VACEVDEYALHPLLKQAVNKAAGEKTPEA
jgi:hypothetical protein